MKELPVEPVSMDKSTEDNNPENINSKTHDVHSSALDQAMWSLLVLLSRKLQVSSASIKAGVSSLLDNSIFWDGSTQHEFLESINSSSDQVSRLIMLLSLVSRAKAGNFEMKVESHLLQEIVAVARERVLKDDQQLTLELSLPQSGKPVWVDYEYLMLSLRFLIEVLSEINQEPKILDISIYELEHNWKLEVVWEKPVQDVFVLLIKGQIVELITTDTISPENRLKLYVVYRIFFQLNIITELVDLSDHMAGLRIFVPCPVTIPKSEKK
jgi:hypothetical protein